MTDQDYIKAGVELADGWEITTGLKCVISPVELYGKRINNQICKDALAAQLYRQCVDAGESVAWLCDGLNTIKAIVDSGVLK